MKVLVTRELGRLATWLRIIGIDAAYSRDSVPGRIIIHALREERTIVTRNTHLATSGRAGIIVLSSEVLQEQLRETLKALKHNLNSAMMFSRCTKCNLALEPLSKEAVKGKVPDLVFDSQKEFSRCPRCSRIYWPGTHWGNVAKALEELT